MSDVTPGSWQPDPFGRFAQRYWDGNDWTQNVIDASGAPSTDPPVSSVPPAAGASSNRGPKPPAIVLALVGLMCVGLSVFVLNWYTFGGPLKDNLRQSDDELFQEDFGISASDAADGLKLSEMSTLVDHAEGNTLSAATEQYVSWGYLAAAAVAVLGVLVLFTSGFHRPVAVIALLIAGWHVNTVLALSDSSSDTEIGAWLGAVGLVIVAIALVLPRRRSAPAVA